jgi:hypothetical protein
MSNCGSIKTGGLPDVAAPAPISVDVGHITHIVKNSGLSASIDRTLKLALAKKAEAKKLAKELKSQRQKRSRLLKRVANLTAEGMTAAAELWKDQQTRKEGREAIVVLGPTEDVQGPAPKKIKTVQPACVDGTSRFKELGIWAASCQSALLYPVGVTGPRAHDQAMASQGEAQAQSAQQSSITDHGEAAAAISTATGAGIGENKNAESERSGLDAGAETSELDAKSLKELAEHKMDDDDNSTDVVDGQSNGDAEED